MAKVVVSGKSQRLLLSHRNLSGVDRARVDSREVLTADVRPSVYCLARATQWQDSRANPGWEIEQGTSFQPVLAGTLWPSAIEDGGFVRIFCTGTWNGGSGTPPSSNPTLLFWVRAWDDFWADGGPTGATTFGPGAAGWGFSNTQTGQPSPSDDISDGTTRRFVFDVELHSLGADPSQNVLSKGEVLVSELVPADGYGGVPTQYAYQILGTDALDLRKEYELTLTVGLTASATGDAIHIDAAEMWLFGSRHGHELLD